ncbi:MAG TPA: ABC transporter permease [Lacunisphaera sp.]
MNFIARLKSLFGSKRRETDMTEEMRLHLEHRTKENIAAGMSPDEARYAAELRFGNITCVQEQIREQHRWVWREQILKDAGFALRSLSRARAFTITVIATLTVGIGVATVVFDLSSWILFRAQPYPDSGKLYIMEYKDKQGSLSPWRSALYFQAYQEQTNVSTEFAAVKASPSNVVIEKEPVFAHMRLTSIDFFHTLGITPALGRTFLPGEHLNGSDNVIVVSDLFWRQHFHADPDVLGRKVRIDEQICTVIGVLAAAQPLPVPFGGDVYRPFVPDVGSRDFSKDPRGIFDPSLAVICRLRTGVTLSAAQQAFAKVTVNGLPAWATAYFAGQELTLTTLTDSSRPEIYWVMVAAAGFLYAIACLNTMNLILVRLLARRRELTIRLAVGGSRWQVIRLLVIENGSLALAAGVLVVLIARWLFPVILVFFKEDEALRYLSYWDGYTLGCIALLSGLAFLSVLIVPVVRLLKSNLHDALKQGGTAKGESRAMGRTRNALVIFQAALAVILLTGTGLMVTSFERLHQVDLGFDPAGKVKVQILFSPSHEPPNLAERLEVFDRLQQKLVFVPGVKAVSYGSDSLLIGAFYGTAQLQMNDGSFAPVAGGYVADDFDRAAGLTLKKGKWLSGKIRPAQVVINETLARKRFGDQNPIGQLIKIQVDATPHEVVGVIKDVRDMARSAGTGMHLYFPNSISYPLNINTLILQFNSSSGKVPTEMIRKAIYDFDPNLIAGTILPMAEVVSNSMAAERYAFKVLRALTSIAVGLAIIGMFSVVTFTVNARMQEFGVRTALGATPGNLRQLVMTRGLITVISGLLIGTAGALSLTRFMQSLLFETTPYDPVVYLSVTGILLVAAILACWLPARRAAKVDPVIALRAE